MRRNYVASTLIRRYFYVMCPLGANRIHAVALPAIVYPFPLQFKEESCVSRNTTCTGPITAKTQMNRSVQSDLSHRFLLCNHCKVKSDSSDHMASWSCAYCRIFSRIARSPGSSVGLALAYWSSGPSSIPARGEIFYTVNGVSLHTTFHYQPSAVLIWLKYCWKGRKIAQVIHPSIYSSPIPRRELRFPK